MEGSDSVPLLPVPAPQWSRVGPLPTIRLEVDVRPDGRTVVLEINHDDTERVAEVAGDLIAHVAVIANGGTES